MPRLKRGTFSCLRPILSGLVACCIGIGSPSCGSWGGNPPSSKVQTGTTAPVEKQGTVEIILQGSGTNLLLLDKSLAVVDKNGKAAGKITLDSVQLVLSDITVRRSRSDQTPTPRLAGPFVLDLLTNSISPQPEKLLLPEGEYKDISLNLYQKSGGSVQLKGTYVNANQKTSSLRITLDAEDQISLLKDGATQGIQVTADSSQQIAITFKLDQWFNFKDKDADLSHATGQDIVIDASATGESQKLRNAFLSNVKAAADFDKVTAATEDKNDKKKDGDHNHQKDDGNGKGSR
jgi:hypothetical protein